MSQQKLKIAFRGLNLEQDSLHLVGCIGETEECYLLGRPAQRPPEQKKHLAIGLSNLWIHG